MNKWIIKNIKNLFSNKIFNLKDIECYHPVKSVSHDFYIIESPDWINVVAITKDNQFILVKQHRLGTNEFTIETPAGIIEKDEPPEEAAQRELLEETGYKANELLLLKKLSSNPAVFNNQIFFFLARDCKKIAFQNLDKTEDIEIQLHSSDEVISMIKDGSINHSIIITALSLYFLSPYCDLDVTYS